VFLLQEVLEAIADAAFKVSEYPVILSFENHCSYESNICDNCPNFFFVCPLGKIKSPKVWGMCFPKQQSVSALGRLLAVVLSSQTRECTDPQAQDCSKFQSVSLIARAQIAKMTTEPFHN